VATQLQLTNISYHVLSYLMVLREIRITHDCDLCFSGSEDAKLVGKLRGSMPNPEKKIVVIIKLSNLLSNM